MDDTLLEALLAAPDDGAWQELIGTYALGIETVEALKVHSARFYFDNPAEAVRVAEVARRLGDLLPGPAPALGKWTLANALLFADYYQAAVDLFDRARADYLALGHSLAAAQMGVGQVWALAYTGQFARALALAAEVEPVLSAAAQTDLADRRRLAGLFNNVGIVYDLMGQYEEALAAYDRKLEIVQTLDNPLEVARTQHNRACALTYLNAFDEALSLFKEAEAGFLPAGATADLARLAYNQGTLYARWGRYAEAEAQFMAADQWLSTLEEVEQARATLAVYRVLARLRNGHAPDIALLNELTAAQVQLATQGPLFEEGLAWLGLGHCYLALNDLPAAQNGFAQALAVAERGGGRPLAWEALHGLGHLAEQRNDLTAAVEFYERAIAQIETLRRDLRIGAFRAGFLADKLIVYQDLALLHVRLGQLEEAFAAVERSRSRLLAEQLTSRLNDEVAALTASQDPDLRQLACQLQELLAQLEQLYNQAASDEAAARGEVWLSVAAPVASAAVAALEEEILALARKIECGQPLFSPLTTGQIAPLPAVLAHLQQATLVQYHIARGQVWAFVVDCTGIRTHRALSQLAEVEAARRRFSAAVERALGLAARYGREALTRYLPALVTDAEAQLAILYDLLLRPLAVYLPPGTPLVISPDGPLYYVPFQALFDGAVYLVEQHSVSYIPSATLLHLCAQPLSTGRGMLVTGYSGGHLNEITAEVQALAELCSEADLLSETQATAEQWLAAAPRYRLLHLATHARFRADRVMLSALSLADRRLALAEVARLQLSAELVTLSGCETGRGRLHGADLIGLACGFLGAGARSLLVSLWRVDDATTARLMQVFYRALLGGAGRAEALRTAQLELLALGREQPTDYGAYRHPAYWAPFVLIGAGGQLVNL